jgi:hypothetical protein
LFDWAQEVWREREVLGGNLTSMDNGILKTVSANATLASIGGKISHNSVWRCGKHATFCGLALQGKADAALAAFFILKLK